MSFIFEYLQKILYCITIAVLFIVILDLYIIWNLLELLVSTAAFLFKIIWGFRFWLALALIAWLLISNKNLI